MSTTTVLVIAGYFVTIASGIASTVLAGRFAARNAREGRLHEMRVEVCAQAMEYGQIAISYADRAEDDPDVRGGHPPAAGAAEPIAARLRLLAPGAADELADLVRRFDGFAFWCGENIAQDGSAEPEDTKALRDACDTLTKSLQRAIAT